VTALSSPQPACALLAALLLAALPAAAADPSQPVLEAADAQQRLASAYAGSTQDDAGFVAGQAQAAAGDLANGGSAITLPTDEAVAILGRAGAQGGQAVAFLGDSGSLWLQAGTAVAVALLEQACPVPTATGPVQQCTVPCPAPAAGGVTLGTAPRSDCVAPLPGAPVPGVAAVDPGQPNVTLAASPAAPAVRGPLLLAADARNTLQVSSLAITDGGHVLASQSYDDTAASRHLEVEAALPEGRHALRAEASGGVQNGTSAVWSVVVDRTAPVSHATVGAAGVALAAQDLPAPGADAASGVGHLSLRLYAAGDVPPGFSDLDGAQADVPVAPGPHVLEYYATDAAGNPEEAQTLAIDLAAPPVAPAPQAPAVPPAVPAAPQTTVPVPVESAVQAAPAAQLPAEDGSMESAPAPGPLRAIHPPSPLAQPWPYLGALGVVSAGLLAYLLLAPRRRAGLA
jgi:hypothetical protein